MKFASYKGPRDGRLMIVSRDLTKAVAAAGVAPTLQALLDDWDALAPKAQAISDALNAGDRPDAEVFDPARCAAPLPRAYSWTDASVYLNHMRLMMKLTGFQIAPEVQAKPIVIQCGSDVLQGPHDEIALPEAAAWGLDYEAELGVITGDVPMQASREEAIGCIRLITILNDVSLRTILDPELRAGFGVLMGKPATAFAPVAATPDEFGDAWRDGKLEMTMTSAVNGKPIGRLNTRAGMEFDFGEIIAHLTRSREVCAGAIVGSGTISNPQDLERSAVSDGGVGSGCLAEVRTIEGLRFGEARTPYLDFGDRVRIELLDAQGRSVLGAIDQTVVLRTVDVGLAVPRRSSL